MELFPIITKTLLAFGGIFLIVLIISFLISKFRNEKEEVITESYPAERYQYYSNSDIESQNYYQSSNSIDRTSLNQQVYEQYPVNYQNQYPGIEEVGNENMNLYADQWIDYEEEVPYENPLRKTSSFSTGFSTEANGLTGGRMQIINEVPLFKFGWE